MGAFVGRARELELVQAELAATRGVVIVGPAGVGKSTLAREALRTRRRPWRAAGGVATLAWHPMLLPTQLLDRRTAGSPESVASTIARELVGHDLLVDDLQWADPDSIACLALLVGRHPTAVTVREGSEASRQVTTALAAAGAAVLALQPLTGEEARSLAELRHPELSPDEISALVEASGGNPLLIEELGQGSSVLPSLGDALRQRSAELPQGARDALVRLALLARPATAEEVDGDPEALVTAGLAVHDGGRLALRHALVGEPLAASLDADQRIRHHGALADALERTGSLGEAALHALAAGRREQACRLAQQEAARSTDPRERGELLSLAAEAGDGSDRDRLRVRAAGELLDGGSPARVAALLADVGRADDEMAALVAGLEARAAFAIGDVERCRAKIEEGLGRVRGTGSSAEVQLMIFRTSPIARFDLDGEASLAAASQALDLAERTGLHQLLARSRYASALLTANKTGWEEQLLEVIDEARELGDVRTTEMAGSTLAIARWVHGDPAGALQVVEDHLARQPEGDLDGFFTTHRIVLRGLVRPDQEQSISEGGDVLAAWPISRHRAFVELEVALSLSDLGRAGATAVIGDPEVGNLQERAVRRWARAEVARAEGRLEGAMAEVGPAMALGLGDFPAVVLTRLAGGHAALELGAPLDSPAPTAQFPGFAAVVEEWEGLVAAASGDATTAVRAFDAAADAWVGRSLRSEVRCREAAAVAALAAGHDPAVARARDALDLARRWRLAPVVERLERALRRAGARTGPPTTEPHPLLSPRETEVLLLVAAGATTAQAADQLGLKPSTIDSQVRSAVRKLGAANRREAAARVRREVGPGS